MFLLFLYLFCGIACLSNDVLGASTTDVCDVGPKGGIPWILKQRELNHGWREHTHRANIALAVGGWKGTETEMRKMELQLELEITMMLLRNNTVLVHENDLALFIHALLATNKNPRNFHGMDLVADLLHRVQYNTQQVHPFIVLTLCNAGAVDFDHLVMIKDIALKEISTRQQIEMKALALKAFACAATNRSLDKFEDTMNSAVTCLISKQGSDGSFGNAYTTALAVQALHVSKTKRPWKLAKAVEYLKRESEKQVNMIKAYIIIMALNTHNVSFIKDLYKGVPEVPKGPDAVDTHFVQYSVVADPNLYYTITLKVPVQWNFVQIMDKCSRLNNHFNYTSYLNQQNKPVVYSVSGIPNDAEENKFWLLCVSRRNRNGYEELEFADSPAMYTPRANDHVSFLYRDSIKCRQ